MTNTHFDGISRQLAAGTSRRQALRLIAGGLGASVLTMVGAAPAVAERCRRAGERCNAKRPCCTGVCCGNVCCADGQVCQSGVCADPAPGPGPNLVICVCADGTQLNACADIDCASGIAQDSVCGPLCVPHGGESATGCLANDATCAVA
jgi:hypothetical protein